MDILRKIQYKIILVGIAFLLHNCQYGQDYSIEEIQQIHSLKIKSIKEYNYQTNLKDSILIYEFLRSITKIKSSKKDIQLKTIYFEQTGYKGEHADYLFNYKFQTIKEDYRSNNYNYLMIYYYNNKGQLTEEKNTVDENFAKYETTTKYHYDSLGRILRSEELDVLGNWAKDSLFYIDNQLIKKVHYIPIDTNPSITLRENFETSYYYENQLLRATVSNTRYTKELSVDSFFYNEKNILTTQITYDVAENGTWTSKFELHFDEKGRSTGYIYINYPDSVAAEVIQKYDEKGLLVLNIFINYNANKKYISRYIYDY